MLTIIPRLTALGLPSRRAVRAAAFTIELAGGSLPECAIGSGGLPPTGIYHPSARLLLIPTACEAPLLAEHVEEIVRTTQEDAVLVRLNTAVSADPLVTYDIFVRRHWDVERHERRLACLPEPNGPLWFVPRERQGRPIQYTTEGLRFGAAGSLGADAIARGVRAAAELVRKKIWGGF